MIHNHDRSKWFGASDTAMIMGNWNTKTFEKWWLEKCGVPQKRIVTKEMVTGTNMEHRILDFIGCKKRDRQIRYFPLRLRVNLDGENRHVISEIKTHSAPRFKVSKTYWQQCQVEMFATGLYLRKRKTCQIVAYRVLEEDHINFFSPIEENRLSYHPIEYDLEFIEIEYLPRLKYLAKCLRRGAWPDFGEFKRGA